MIRSLDIAISIIVLVAISPLLVIIGLVILTSEGCPILYIQRRVGRNGKEFNFFKFRTMRLDADSQLPITIGRDDVRITKVGRALRRYKLDELPQFLNVLIGNMSIVGPRPEIRKYVDFNSQEWRMVLSVKPGITDYASIYFFNDNHMLVGADDPERVYVERIIPRKIELNMHYISNPSIGAYLKIIILTIQRIVFNR